MSVIPFPGATDDGPLSPTRRQAIYAALVMLGGIVTAAGLADDSVVTGWLGVAQAALGVAGLVLAAIKTRSVDYTALYSVAAAAVVALKVVGVFTDGQSSHILDIAASVTAFLPLAVAAFRTTPATPTGEPLAEYAAKHAA